jgi:DNA-binding CsgD family transcriptional regulator
VTRIEILQILAQAENRSGATARAEARFAEAIELAQQFGLEQLEANARAARAHLDALFGRVEETRRACAWIREASERTSEGLMAVRTGAILGVLELSLGNAPAALAELERGIEVLEQYGIRDPGLYPVFSFAVDAAAETGDIERAEALTRSYEQFAAAHPRPRANVLAHRTRGIVEASRGNFDDALGALERAVAEQEALPAPFEHGLTLFWLGRVRRRARQRRAARDALEGAARIFEQLGYPLWLERVHDELGRIGGRAAARDELTQTERRVATLVAQGKTNKEVAAELVVTVRAVEANLSRIYTKLGVRSRAELAHRFRPEEEMRMR